MQPRPQNLAYILEHAARVHGGREVVSATVEGGLHRYSYRDALGRTKQLANALRRLGLAPGDRVATLAWNGYRHLEAWYAIAGQGAICHTVNPRLFPEQIAYILNHAADRFVLVDLNLLPVLERVRAQVPSIEAVVVMTDRAHMPDGAGLLCYEELLAAEPADFAWPELPEATPSSLCYTSGTTGNPKGVLYTHRSNLLMAYACNGAEGFALSALSTVLMVVPMFHANSWGLVYCAPMAGAKLVLPGPHLGGRSLHGLITGEQATFSAAVPTIWTQLLQHLEATGGTLPSLQEVVIGGSAVPAAMIRTFAERYGVAVRHAWGMTELSPIGTVNRPTPEVLALDPEAQLAVAAKQGRPPYGVEMRIADEAGRTLASDGRTQGRLLVRGPWTVDRYYREENSACDADGWFDTGDIATLDPLGYMQITDRAKDVIKSGGEWISSVELENTAMGHPAVALAACIGLPHPRWDERPLLVVQLREGAEPCGDALIGHLAERVARWWLPDDVVFVEAIPLAATGKINKLALRQQFSGYVWAAVASRS
ncbi:MAG: long-chain fatty acid--CoA ligase [Alphaproteobacteria bacterium]